MPRSVWSLVRCTRRQTKLVRCSPTPPQRPYPIPLGRDEQSFSKRAGWGCRLLPIININKVHSVTVRGSSVCRLWSLGSCKLQAARSWGGGAKGAPRVCTAWDIPTCRSSSTAAVGVRNCHTMQQSQLFVMTQPACNCTVLQDAGRVVVDSLARSLAYCLLPCTCFRLVGADMMSWSLRA